MFFKLIKIILFIGWSGFIVVMYYRSHPSYLASAEDIWPMFYPLFLFFGLVFLIIFIYVAYRHRQKQPVILKITPFSLAIFCLINFLIVFNFISISKDTTVYHGDPLIKNEAGRIDILPEGKTSPPAGFYIIYKDGDIVTFTTQRLANYPAPIRKLFTRPDFWFTQMTLLKQLGVVFLALLLIFLSTQVVGQKLLALILGKENPFQSLEKYLLNQGLGLGLLMVELFVLGNFGLLGNVFVWPLLLAPLIVFYKLTLKIFTDIWRSNWRLSLNVKDFVCLGGLATVLVFLLSAVLIMVVRPYPAGWDEISVYLNLPHLISESRHLLSGFLPYNTELLLSLGFILFNSVPVAIALAFSFQILSAMLIYTLSGKFFSKPLSLFLATLFLSLPMVVWQAGFDTKIDSALFFYCGLAGLSFYYYWQTGQNKLLYLAGAILGLSLGIKITATIFIFSLLVLLGYKKFGLTCAVGFLNLGWLIFVFMGKLHLGDTSDLKAIDSSLKIFTALVFLITASLIFIKHRQKLWLNGRPIIFFLISVAIFFSPWLIRNGILSKTLTPGQFLTGPQASIAELETIGLPAASCQPATGQTEFMDQLYFGDETTTAKRFLRLPWEMTMNNFNTKLYVQISFFFLAFLPLVVLFWPPKKDRKFWICLIVFSLTYFSYWLFTANAIIWYGLPGFLGLLLLIGFVFDRAPVIHRLLPYYLAGLSLLWFFSIIPTYLGYANNNHLVAYLEGNIDSNIYLNGFFPGLSQVSQIITDDTANQDKLIYRIGTFVTYFIPNNNRRLFSDENLDFFNCLYQEKNKDLTADRLRQLNFKYLIAVNNVGAIERDPNGTLHKKAEQLYDFLSDNSALELLVDAGGYKFYRLK